MQTARGASGRGGAILTACRPPPTSLPTRWRMALGHAADSHARISSVAFTRSTYCASAMVDVK